MVVVLAALYYLAMAVTLVALTASCYLTYAPALGWPQDLARAVWSELRPFYLPAAVLFAAVEVQATVLAHPRPMAILAAAIFLAAWWQIRKDDHDDRWRRRARHAASRVARAGGRLQVVPAAVAGRP